MPPVTLSMPARAVGVTTYRNPLTHDTMGGPLLDRGQAGGTKLPGPDGLPCRVTKAMLQPVT
jgi:hypothetical protein